MRLWRWLASTIEDYWLSDPVAVGSSSATDTVQTVAQLVLQDGAPFQFAGSAIEWDVAKASTVALDFRAPWFAEREIELFLWSSDLVEIELHSPDIAGAPVRLKLQPNDALQLRLQVLPNHPATGGTVRLRANAIAPAGSSAKVRFGLADHASSLATRIRPKLRFNRRLALYIATWMNLACILFIAMAGFGVKGVGGGLFTTVILLIPSILERLGMHWAPWLSPGRLAQWIHTKIPRGAPLWGAASIPLFFVTAYMIVAFAYFAIFRKELDNHLTRTTITIGERAEFFCRYPERIETRVLLAKHLEIRAADKSLIKTYGGAVDAVSQDRFLSKCLSRWRLLPLLVQDGESNERNARILYASVLWNPSNASQFAERAKRIRTVLGRFAADDPVAKLALAKYELRAIKNYNEQVACQDAATSACIDGRQACLAARKNLEALLEMPWPEEVRTSVSYIEAHDVAASAHLSTGCSYGSDEDTAAAIGHYSALMGALPTNDDPKLEQPLTQVNFRKYIDGAIEEDAGHQTSRDWRRECRELMESSCTRIKKRFITDQPQKFFERDRGLREKSWGSVSIPYLRDDLLATRLLTESERGWRWPL